MNYNKFETLKKQIRPGSLVLTLNKFETLTYIKKQIRPGSLVRCDSCDSSFFMIITNINIDKVEYYKLTSRQKACVYTMWSESFLSGGGKYQSKWIVLAY